MPVITLVLGNMDHESVILIDTMFNQYAIHSQDGTCVRSAIHIRVVSWIQFMSLDVS
jgi:hypothetical protein